jgi:DNA-binding response OmpR family regulator
MTTPRKFHILLLEDDDAFRRLVTRMLENASFHVIQARDFSSAARIVDGPERVDLLLADIGMPAKTPHGLSAARTSQMRRKGLKVIYMTGGDASQFALHLRDDIVLQKPFTSESLLRAVKSTLMI